MCWCSIHSPMYCSKLDGSCHHQAYFEGDVGPAEYKWAIPICGACTSITRILEEASWNVAKLLGYLCLGCIALKEKDRLQEELSELHSRGDLARCCIC
jgi:hypothetical protein